MSQKSEKIPLDILLDQLQYYPGLKVSLGPSATDEISFSAWAQYWLKTWIMGTVKDISYDCTYREPVEAHLIPHFGAVPIKNIRPSDIQEYFNLKASRCALETIKKQLMCLKRILLTATENGMCGTRSASGAGTPSSSWRKGAGLWSAGEQEAPPQGGRSSPGRRAAYGIKERYCTSSYVWWSVTQAA